MESNTIASSVPVVPQTQSGSSKKILIIVGIVIFVLLTLCCGLGVFAYYYAQNNKKDDTKQSNNDDKKDPTPTSTPAVKQITPLSARASLDKANTLAKEKYPKAVLVLVGDDQGKSSLYFTIGGDKTKEQQGNKNGTANRWMYFYVKDPSQITADEKSDYYGKYKIKKEQGFIVDATHDEVEIRRESFFGDYNLHSIKDITEDVKKLETNDVVAKVIDTWKNDIAGFNFKEDQLKDIDIKIQNIAYVDLYDKNKSEIRPIWNIDIIYNDPTSTSYEKTRSFSAKVNALDGKVDKGIIYPAKK